MFGTVYCFVLLVASMAPVPKAIERDAFLAACQAQETELLKFFSDDDVWQPKRNAELLTELQIAGVVRPKGIVAKLLRHMAYTDDKFARNSRIPSPEQLYPAYGALKKYGAAVIAELFTYLKRDEQIEEGPKARIEAFLAAYLLCELSDDPAVGKALARIRIQHELDRHPKADFPRLKAILAR